MFVEQFLSHQSECLDILWVFLAGHFLAPNKPGSIPSLPTAPQKLIIIWISLYHGKKLPHNSGVAQILATITRYNCWSAVSTKKGWPHDAVSACASSITVLIVQRMWDVSKVCTWYWLLAWHPHSWPKYIPCSYPSFRGFWTRLQWALGSQDLTRAPWKQWHPGIALGYWILHHLWSEVLACQGAWGHDIVELTQDHWLSPSFHSFCLVL